MVQNILVACVALGAAAFVLRRVLVPLRPSEPPGCASCAVKDLVEAQKKSERAPTVRRADL